MMERTVTLVWVILILAAASCRGEQPAPGPSGAPVSMPEQPAEKTVAPEPVVEPAFGEKEWAVACNFAVDLLKDETDRRFAEQFAQAAGADKEVLERTRKGMMDELDQAVGKCMARLKGLKEARARKACKCLNDSRDIKELKACDPLMQPEDSP